MLQNMQHLFFLQALKDNQSKELLGCRIVLNLAKQTPQSGNRGCSQKPGQGICNSIYIYNIRGFDKHLAVDKIRSALEQHFGECGEITRVSIPLTDNASGRKGFAFIDFKDQNSVSKALELDGSDRLHVAKARGNVQPHGGGISGDRSGGRDGGRGRGGGRRPC
ncbi:hypothetical protein SORBI_3005G002350 [Sorghum bicolor]|uniref:RRM domain-containing protein n=1 Tax=Sorghum bicolor TaxID=4558 RepID=A0A1Z5RFY8_SORBI|nr:hypothetical protein SORBI_3005G002350 [Sorghum bicolor]